MVDISGSLDSAVASAVLDLTEQANGACPGDPGGTRVLEDRPVAMTLMAIDRPLRILSSGRIRIPGQRNDIHLQRQTIHTATGILTVDTVTQPATRASIEGDQVVVHEDGGLLAMPAAMPFLAALANVEHTRQSVLLARGAATVTAAEIPPPGGELGRHVDVIAETGERHETTLYALAVTDTVIDCEDGGFGILSQQRYGQGAGTLEVGPRYDTAVAAAQMTMAEYLLNGCTGEVTEDVLTAVPVSLDLTAGGPLVTATDFRIFVAAPYNRGHERVTVTGREGVSGTVRVGDLETTASYGGIGHRSAVYHRTETP